MSAVPSSLESDAPHPPHSGSKRWYHHLYVWVLIGVIAGIMLGRMNPELAKQMKPLGEAFVNLVKMLIGPIVFLTVVAGISSVGDLKQVGRVGLKALVYFELVTTLAMLIALGVVHLAKPGVGINFRPPAADLAKVSEYADKAKDSSMVEFVMHIIPKTFVSAFSEGEILQVLLVAILMGIALAKLGPKGKPLTDLMQVTTKAFFGVVSIIVWLAPIAAFGAMASTVASAGTEALIALLKMMACFYLTCVLFIFGVLGLLARAYGFSLLKYLRHIKDEILLVLGTSSSESALPPMMEKLEKTGCAQNVVGIVLPSGYSFNLDGTSIYLAMAIVFLAQATNTPLSLAQELGLLGLLLLTSKGAAAVTGGGFITLAATLSSTHHDTLVAGLALLIGIDRFMSEARAITNLIGNGLATFIIAKSEGELDHTLAAPVLSKPWLVPENEQ